MAESGREIAAAGRPLPVLFDGAPAREIPPMAPWIVSILFLALGVGDFAARLGFVILSVAASLVLLAAGREAARGRDPRGCAPGDDALPSAVGLLSAIVLASTPLFGRYAPHVIPEIPLAFFTAVALLGWLAAPRRRSGAALWAIGVAGGVLSGGAAGLLVVLGALVVAAIERGGRARWRDPWFVGATAAGVAAGLLWLVPAGSGGGFAGSPLWAPLASIVRPGRDAGVSLVVAVKDVWLRSLPWSIAAAAAVARLIVSRPKGPADAPDREIDSSLAVFMAVAFLPLALGGAEPMKKFLPVVPFASLLAAREVARWVSHGARDAARRVTVCNQALTALFLLLMLLVVATPFRIRSSSGDAIREVARAAARIAPEGERIGNYRRPLHDRGARMLLYGGRRLEGPIATPEELAAALRADPDRVFLSSVADLDSLRAAGDFPFDLRVLFGEGDLVLFGARGVRPGEAP